MNYQDQIESKWHKFKARARLVARSFLQNIDDNEVFGLVSKIETIRLVVTLPSIEN